MGGVCCAPTVKVDTKKQPVVKEEAKKRRDLYLEMMREAHPDFASIPKDKLLKQVKILDKSDDPHAAPTDVAFSEIEKSIAVDDPREEYPCQTQQNDTLEELFLGLYHGRVTLWKNGSVINWTARADGYPNKKMALEAAVAVYEAARRWNEVMEGRIQFKYVSIFDDASFTITFNNDKGNTLARAFFPDAFEQTMNFLYVFNRSYANDVRRHFVNTMLHELGHVLGLRHEHSQSGIKNWYGPGRDSEAEDRPNGAESILWGMKNPRSVMAYYRGQTIQNSDAESIRLAYDELHHGKVIMGQGKLDTIRKTIVRVEPNN